MDKVHFRGPGTVGRIIAVLGVIVVLVLIARRIVDALDQGSSPSPLASGMSPIHSTTSGSIRPGAIDTAAGANVSSEGSRPPTVNGNDGGTEIERPRRSLNWS